MPISDDLTPTFKPGDDFYDYVNQAWCEQHPIPGDKARVTAFSVLADENVERLHVILEAPAATDEPYDIQLLRQFYAAAMDEAAIESAGLEALKPYLEKVEALSGADGIKQLLQDWHALGMGLIWAASVEPDDKNSSRYVLRLHQSGLGLPDRDYYTEGGERFETIRAQYREFLVSFFELRGSGDAGAAADDVLAIESKLAEASATAVEQRDVDGMYNHYGRPVLAAEFSGLDWNGYLKALNLSGLDGLIVSQPKFIREALRLLGSEPLDRWRNYLRFHLVRPLMSKLPKAYDELNFSFYGRVLSGAETQEPRFRRIIGLAENVLPEPIGRLFVEHHFDEAAKRTIANLVDDVQAALRARIGNLDWMTEATKRQALDKLDTFLPLLGYPEDWRDYSELKLPGGHTANFLAAAAHEWRYDTGRINDPVDRRQWLMSPATVNAYYWPNTNGITFPAGILQPPYFDANGDVASNYGAIGVVIGHEITHGFDDKGSKFDKAGDLKSWWSDEDRAAFDSRTAKLKQQYDGYELGGTHVNGELTLGENTADLGGVLIAYDALQRHLEATGSRDDIDGLSPEQRFFISYARVWRGNVRPELEQNFLVIDPHAPGRFRVNGVLPNVDAFYEAFIVVRYDKLFLAPESRVRIW